MPSRLTEIEGVTYVSEWIHYHGSGQHGQFAFIVHAYQGWTLEWKTQFYDVKGGSYRCVEKSVRVSDRWSTLKGTRIKSLFTSAWTFQVSFILLSLFRIAVASVNINDVKLMLQEIRAFETRHFIGFRRCFANTKLWEFVYRRIRDCFVYIER